MAMRTDLNVFIVILLAVGLLDVATDGKVTGEGGS
jgi:hypothetical protein